MFYREMTEKTGISTCTQKKRPWKSLTPSSLKCIRIRTDTEECAAAPSVKFQPSGNRPEANRCQISHSARFHSPFLLPTLLYTLPSACLPFSQLLHGLDSFMIKFYCNKSWRGVHYFASPGTFFNAVISTERRCPSSQLAPTPP